MNDRTASRTDVTPLMERILYEVKRVVVGQDRFLERVLVAMLAQGHLLVEGVPGLAKTLTVKTLARTIHGTFRRIQFTPDLMGCELGTSVLGFEKDMETYLGDGVLEKYGVGLYATEEASAETIRKSSYLDEGQTQAALIAPLSFFDYTPQVVVFTADSEQVMWLLYAVNYEKGGRIDLPQSGGALGGCADITALPILAGMPNITFLGLGCRIKTGVDACHLMMGIPGSTLEATHRHLLEMAKPIAILKKASA